MYKIRKISFFNHPILKNLSLDFCDQNGDSVDTIIFAGENGTGKSTIINALYTLVSQTADFEAEVEYEKDNEKFILSYRYKEYSNGKSYLTVNDGAGVDAIIGSDTTKAKYPTSGIYSDVDINFHSKELSSVTSLNLDEETNSRKSSTDLPTQINQLLIDIQALDDADVAFAAKTHPNAKVCNLKVPERIPRFTSAFNRMFDDLTYSRVGNSRGHKHVLFQKNGIDIPINSLSSGEKQIVYRGCFLLKDAEAMCTGP